MADRAEKCAGDIRRNMSSKFIKTPQFTVSDDILDAMNAEIIRSHYPDDRELLEAATAMKDQIVKCGQERNGVLNGEDLQVWERLRTAIAKAERRG